MFASAIPDSHARKTSAKAIPERCLTKAVERRALFHILHVGGISPGRGRDSWIELRPANKMCIRGW